MKKWITTIILSFFFIYVSFSLYLSHINKQQHEQLVNQTNILYEQENYEVYLNGVEIQLENVNLEHYEITIDDANKKIILSK